MNKMVNHSKKSQAALEFLMTYGWAILVVLVAIGALFYSAEENFGYLHDGGVLKIARNKGYQTNLIRHRINVCLEKGISRIYATANHGNQSWRNCIKNGFEQIQVVEVFIEK